MTAPIIALTTYGRNEVNLQTQHYDEWFAIPSLYVDAVRRAGGVPLLLPPGETELDAVLEAVDAVIVIGGGDIHPEHYGGDSAHPDVHGIDRERDTTELALLREVAGEKRLPSLCICRGMQVANVALGGTLVEHIADIVPDDIHRGRDKGWTVQPLEAEAGSKLAEIMGATKIAAYSGHHQALEALGAGLQVSATAEDGIIEAIEKRDHPWFIGVQWHPEMSAAEDESQHRIFEALVEAARARKRP